MMEQDQYQKLIHNHSFKELLAYSNEFDLFKMMGVRRKELIHSNILASFFTPSEPHGLRHNFVNHFINQIKDIQILSGKALNEAVIELALNAKVRVYRELESIDLVLEFPEIKLVIGIENKIWAEEQGKQLERYQETLIRRYPQYNKALVFLAPNKRIPLTHNPELNVPIYCMSYANILECLSDENTATAPDSSKAFISQFKAHIEKYLSRNKPMDELCWQIFKENEEAYGLMVKSYTKCIYRKVEEQFEYIQKQIHSDSMFSDFKDKIIITTNTRPDKKFHIVTNLDVRLNTWPEGIAIRVYKWSWAGCFPYIRNEKIESIKELHQPARELPYDTVKSFEDEKISYFYRLNVGSYMDERRITTTGNDIKPSEIAHTLTKIKDLIVDVNTILELD